MKKCLTWRRTRIPNEMNGSDSGAGRRGSSGRSNNYVLLRVSHLAPPEKKIGPHPGLDGTFLRTTGLALQMEAFTLSAVAQIYLYHSHPSCDDSIRQKFSYSLTFEIEFNFQLSEGWLGVTCWNRILCEEITTTTTLL